MDFNLNCSSVVPVFLQDLNKRQGLALLTKVGESVKHVAGGYKLRARPAEFCAMGEYLDTFTQKLGTIDRIAQRILKEQSGNRMMEARWWLRSRLSQLDL